MPLLRRKYIIKFYFEKKCTYRSELLGKLKLKLFIEAFNTQVYTIKKYRRKKCEMQQPYTILLIILCNFHNEYYLKVFYLV